MVLRGLIQQSNPWALPWPVVHEFFSIVTHSKIFKTPSPPEIAIQTLTDWLNAPTLRLLSEGPVYFENLKTIIAESRITGPLVHDARIAALCLENNVKILLTADRDFSRFPDLKTRNPLIK